jgi:hypothetical protein
MNKVLDERLEHCARTQLGKPLDQRLQLIEPIEDHIPERVECIVVITLSYIE